MEPTALSYAVSIALLTSIAKLTLFRTKRKRLHLILNREQPVKQNPGSSRPTRAPIQRMAG
jgi:hypothetical protein